LSNSLRADVENAKLLEIKLLCGKRFQDLSALTHSQAPTLNLISLSLSLARARSHHMPAESKHERADRKEQSNGSLIAVE
jgi:hypothetical protein